MNITIMNRSVDIALQILSDRQVQLPHHLAVQADNTTREHAGTQFVFEFLAVATAKRLWASVSPVFYIPGHSHNEVGPAFCASGCSSEQGQAASDL